VIAFSRVVGRKLATAVLTLLLITLTVFALIRLAPGSPLAEGADAGGMRRLDPAARAELERLYHLDRPLHEQYALWLGGVLRGDLGRSFHDRRPVAEKIRERIGVTLTLNALALLAMIVAAVPLGALSALRRGSWLDRASAWVAFGLYAVPVFWTALILQIVFAVRLGWLPLSGLDSEGWQAFGPFARTLDRALHLVLPVICLSYGGLAYLGRFVRASLLEHIGAESALAARARGLSSLAVLCRHGFRQAALPMLTLAGLLLPALVGGSVIVENIFAIPGLGRLFVDAAFQRDIPVLMALTLLSGAATLLGILAADLTYAIADPRVRRG
jgi:peptide/nickel transport system permease protein